MKHKSLTLKDIQVRYDPETAEISITSKDPSLKKKPFILNLSGGSPTYNTLLELLEKEGLANLEQTRISKSITIPYPEQTNSALGDFRTRIRIGETFLDKPVELDLADAPHTLIAGAAGTGKSVLQRLIAAHALLHKDQIDLYGIDLMRVELKPYFYDSPENLATTIDEAVDLLVKIRKLSDRTTHGSRKAIYLVVDELATLTTEGVANTEEGRMENEKRRTIQEELLYLACIGRSLGIYLFISTQRPDFKEMNAGLGRMFSHRILFGGAGSQAAYQALEGRPTFGAGLLQFPGRAIVSTLGEQTLTQIYYLQPEHVVRSR